MNLLNDQNIDEIMFQLLEGEIDGSEREKLLEAIQADPKYAALWQTWQQTVLHIDNDGPTINTSKLKRKTAFLIPIYVKYAAAAILVIGLFLGIYNGLKEDVILPLSTVAPEHAKIKKELPQMHHDTDSSLESFKDTFVPLKEKIKYMAVHRVENKNQNAQKPFDTLVVQDLIVSIDLPKNTDEKPLENEKVKKVQEESETILVTIEQGKTSKIKPDVTPTQKMSFLQRLFGSSKIKIEDDENTLTQKKIILENKKYQIIAGF